MPWLINPAQLSQFLRKSQNLIVLDATWFLHTDNRNAKDGFLEKHIAGARFLDLNDFSDTETVLSNMLIRDEKIISKKIGELGITNDHKIIFYDNSSLHTSCRALWMLKTFGHNSNQLYILDGGLDAWEKHGGKIESGESRTVGIKNYTVNFAANNIRTLVQMKTNLHHPMEQVIDARHPVRYAGGQESRIGVRSGHIPGSFCFPYFSLFETNGHWKTLERIRKQFIGMGVSFDHPIVTTCGSGMTAAVLNFALDLLNQTNHALYDGSWAEWGGSELYPGEDNLDERPVVTSLDS